MEMTLPALRSYVASLVRLGEGGEFSAEEAKLLLAALDAQASQADPGGTQSPEPASAEALASVPVLNRIVPTWDTVNPGHIIREGRLCPCHAVLRDRAGEVQGVIYRMDRGWFGAWMGNEGRLVHQPAPNPYLASRLVNGALSPRMGE